MIDVVFVEVIIKPCESGDDCQKHYDGRSKACNSEPSWNNLQFAFVRKQICKIEVETEDDGTSHEKYDEI